MVKIDWLNGIGTLYAEWNSIYHRLTVNGNDIIWIFIIFCLKEFGLTYPIKDSLQCKDKGFLRMFI